MGTSSLTEKMNTIEFCIQISVGAKFKIKLRVLIFRTNLP